ncbi:hypothetical protein [Dyadobacter koreensis]|uniref:hypothetical protein n=1 Tax=Dyadobacter koreensis TaxID=408657 RepID=UPI0015A67F50|nr:hypothetical protein [Dyadobacter koreensis]
MSQSDMAELLVNPFLVNMKSFSVKRGYSLIDKDAAVSKKYPEYLFSNVIH